MKHVLLMSFLQRQEYKSECHVFKGKSTGLNVIYNYPIGQTTSYPSSAGQGNCIPLPMQYHIAKGEVRRGEYLGRIIEYVKIICMYCIELDKAYS